MKKAHLFLSMSTSGKNIKNIQNIQNIQNINIPSCRNCVHYKPTSYNDFDSHINRCEIFGKKDIVTDKISYDFADSCRENETKCGINGTYFEQEKNIEFKIIKHKISSNFLQGTSVLIIGLYIIILLHRFPK